METIDVEKKLKALKKAVTTVTKADKAWLSALETFLEGLDQASNVAGTMQNVVNAEVSVAQAIRLALDEVNFLRYLDNKLEGKVSQFTPTLENLSDAVKEAEAYLVMTNDAFGLLQAVSGDCKNPDSTNDVNPKAESADQVREVLWKSVKELLDQSGVISQGAEPEGTDLLLGRKLNPGSECFLQRIPADSKDFTRTRALLEGQHLTLSDSQIKGLTNSWGKAVTSFVRDSPPQAKTVPELESQEFTSLDTIAKFLCVHSVLETLYDRLETRVTRTDEDILSPDI